MESERMFKQVAEAYEVLSDSMCNSSVTLHTHIVLACIP